MQDIKFFIEILHSINRYFIFPFFVWQGLNYLWVLAYLLSLIKLSKLDQFAINFILNKPVNIIFFREMPYLFSFNFHGIYMLRLHVMIISMSG